MISYSQYCVVSGLPSMMSTAIPPDTPSGKINPGKYASFKSSVLNLLAISKALFCLGKEADSIFAKPGSFIF